MKAKEYAARFEALEGQHPEKPLGVKTHDVIDVVQDFTREFLVEINGKSDNIIRNKVREYREKWRAVARRVDWLGNEVFDFTIEDLAPGLLARIATDMAVDAARLKTRKAW